MGEILLNGWSLGIVSRGYPWGTVLMGALAVWGLVSPLGRTLAEVQQQTPGQEHLHPPKINPSAMQLATFARVRGLGDRFALVCWLVTPLLAVWLISRRQPLFTDRYLIWTAPAFYMLVALGLASLRRFGDWGRWAVVLLVGIILVFNSVNLRQQATVPIKSDFRAAAAYVADHRSSGELIIFQIPHSRYTFDYYFPKEEYPWAEGLYTNHRIPDGSYLMSEQEAAWHMREMTARYSAVWLVATETTMWDERDLVRAWLEVNAQRVDEAYFTRVDVYRYLK